MSASGVYTGFVKQQNVHKNQFEICIIINKCEGLCKRNQKQNKTKKRMLRFYKARLAE